MSGHVELMSEKYYRPKADPPPEEPADEQPSEKPMTAERFTRYASMVICLCMLTVGGLWWRMNGDAVIDSAAKPYNPMDTMLWLKGSKETTQSMLKKVQVQQSKQMRDFHYQIEEMNQRLRDSFPSGLGKRNRY